GVGGGGGAGGGGGGGGGAGGDVPGGIPEGDLGLGPRRRRDRGPEGEDGQDSRERNETLHGASPPLRADGAWRCRSCDRSVAGLYAAPRKAVKGSGPAISTILSGMQGPVPGFTASS